MMHEVGFIYLLLGVWVCGCFAQAQREGAVMPLPVTSQDTKTCVETRDNLERMFYTAFKGTLPRRMLKEILPGLVEPLLPVVCLQPGSDAVKWQPVLTSSDQAARPLSRPKRQLGGFFMSPGMTPVKDPGDHPPPGMARNPFKDPGDRPFNMFGMRKIKDPGDAPIFERGTAGGGGGGGGETPPGEPVDPFMSSLMSMMRMASFNSFRPSWGMSSYYNPRQYIPGANNRFSGRIFGDRLPFMG